jgi:hypothetical protein
VQQESSRGLQPYFLLYCLQGSLQPIFRHYCPSTQQQQQQLSSVVWLPQQGLLLLPSCRWHWLLLLQQMGTTCLRCF